jgi:hypothetical protein
VGERAVVVGVDVAETWGGAVLDDEHVRRLERLRKLEAARTGALVLDLWGRETDKERLLSREILFEVFRNPDEDPEEMAAAQIERFAEGDPSNPLIRWVADQETIGNILQSLNMRG